MFSWRENTFLFPLFRLTIACLLLFSCHDVVVLGESPQSESVSNQNIAVSNSHETIKYGNTKHNSYKFRESNYQPAQHTQVVFNVGKLDKNKWRRSRPPTVEEYAVKQRIMSVYNTVLAELNELGLDSVHLRHLGRILTALNPKYIATQRVWKVAIAPSDAPLDVQAPESVFSSPLGSSFDHDCNRPVVELSGNGKTPIFYQLDELDRQLKNFAVWDEAFEQQLLVMPDNQFTPRQLAFKRLIQCLANPASCKQKTVELIKVSHRDYDPASKPASQEFINNIVQEASELRHVKVKPPQIAVPNGEHQARTSGANNEPVVMSNGPPARDPVRREYNDSPGDYYQNQSPQQRPVRTMQEPSQQNYIPTRDRLENANPQVQYGQPQAQQQQHRHRDLVRNRIETSQSSGPALYTKDGELNPGLIFKYSNPNDKRRRSRWN